MAQAGLTEVSENVFECKFYIQYAMANVCSQRKKAKRNIGLNIAKVIQCYLCNAFQVHTNCFHFTRTVKYFT